MTRAKAKQLRQLIEQLAVTLGFGTSNVYINAEPTVLIAFDGSQWTGRTLTLPPYGLVGLKR